VLCNQPVRPSSVFSVSVVGEEETTVLSENEVGGDGDGGGEGGGDLFHCCCSLSLGTVLCSQPVRASSMLALLDGSFFPSLFSSLVLLLLLSQKFDSFGGKL